MKIEHFISWRSSESPRGLSSSLVTGCPRGQPWYIYENRDLFYGLPLEGQAWYIYEICARVWAFVGGPSRGHLLSRNARPSRGGLVYIWKVGPDKFAARGVRRSPSRGCSSLVTPPPSRAGAGIYMKTAGGRRWPSRAISSLVTGGPSRGHPGIYMKFVARANDCCGVRRWPLEGPPPHSYGLPLEGQPWYIYEVCAAWRGVLCRPGKYFCPASVLLSIAGPRGPARCSRDNLADLSIGRSPVECTHPPGGSGLLPNSFMFASRTYPSTNHSRR